MLERRVPPPYFPNPETTFESLMDKLFGPQPPTRPRRHPLSARPDPVSEALFAKLVGAAASPA